MNPELARLLAEHFRNKGGFSSEEAAMAVECLRATALNLEVDTTHPITDAKCLLGFSWGGRHDQWLNISLPGPQNETIAAQMCCYYEILKSRTEGAEPFVLHVCVQWEIVINSNLAIVVPPEQLHVLRAPVNAMTAKHDHYSTQTLLGDMMDVLLANDVDLRTVPVGLFAHRYHLPRIVEYAKKLGIAQISSPVSDMPSSFDLQSAQAWIRDFRGFFLSNAVSGMAKLRNDLYCVRPEYFP